MPFDLRSQGKQRSSTDVLITSPPFPRSVKLLSHLARHITSCWVTWLVGKRGDRKLRFFLFHSHCFIYVLSCRPLQRLYQVHEVMYENTSAALMSQMNTPTFLYIYQSVMHYHIPLLRIMHLLQSAMSINNIKP